VFPAGVVPAVVVTVIVVEPEPDMVAGLKDLFTPAGSVFVVNETVPLNPPDLVTVTV
jgi:hypothetical protein